jgi:hypothetical protein
MFGGTPKVNDMAALPLDVRKGYAFPKKLSSGTTTLARLSLAKVKNQ